LQNLAAFFLDQEIQSGPRLAKNLHIGFEVNLTPVVGDPFGKAQQKTAVWKNAFVARLKLLRVIDNQLRKSACLKGKGRVCRVQGKVPGHRQQGRLEKGQGKEIKAWKAPGKV